MKKGIITLSIIFICAFAHAQKTEIELVRSAFRLEKKAIVAEFLKLSEEDAGKFWPIYEKYEQDRAAIGTRRINLVETYIDKYETMDDATADALVKESGAIQKKEIALREKYYGTVKKSISISVASRFYQIEDAINVGTRMELYSEIPLLDKK